MAYFRCQTLAPELAAFNAFKIKRTFRGATSGDRRWPEVLSGATTLRLDDATSATKTPMMLDRLIELPFVMGVMSDLSGNAPGVEKANFADRKFLEFDMDNFDSRMGAIQPGVTMRVDNKLSENPGDKLSVNLRFNKMDDFSPAAVARQVPATAKLLEAREQRWRICFATWMARWRPKIN